MCAVSGSLHRPPGFERRQNGVEVDWCAAENLIAQRIRKRVQDRAAAAAHGRFADAAGADRRFRDREYPAPPIACSTGTSRMVGGLLW